MLSKQKHRRRMERFRGNYKQHIGGCNLFMHGDMVDASHRDVGSAVMFTSCQVHVKYKTNTCQQVAHS